jgi:hypothetical protein
MSRAGTEEGDALVSAGVDFYLKVGPMEVMGAGAEMWYYRLAKISRPCWTFGTGRTTKPAGEDMVVAVARKARTLLFVS